MTLRDRPAWPTGRVARAASPEPSCCSASVSLLTDVSSEMVARGPAALPHRRGRPRPHRVRLPRRPLPGRQRRWSGSPAGYAGDRGQRPKWVAAAGYGVSALSRLAMLPAHGLGRHHRASITADRLGKGLRTAPRDALIADAVRAGHAGPLVRRTPDAGHPRRRHRAAGRLRAARRRAGQLRLGLRRLVRLRDRRGGGPGAVRARPAAPQPAARARVAAAGVRGVTAPALRRPLLAAALLGLFDRSATASSTCRCKTATTSPPRYFPLLYVGTNVAYLALAIPLGRLADRIGRARCSSAGTSRCWPATWSPAAPLAGWRRSRWSSCCCSAPFYAATDGVLPALVEPAGAGRRAGQRHRRRADRRWCWPGFAASLLFGLLWSVQGPATGALRLLAALLAGATRRRLAAARPTLRRAQAARGAPAQREPASASVSTRQPASPSGCGLAVLRRRRRHGRLCAAGRAQAAGRRRPPARPRSQPGRPRRGTRASHIWSSAAPPWATGTARWRLVAARRAGRSARDHPGLLRPGVRDRWATAFCLAANRGLATTYAAQLLDARLVARARICRCPACPSRARLSPDGSLRRRPPRSSSATRTPTRASSPPAPSSAGSPASVLADLETFELVVDGRTHHRGRPEPLGRDLRRRRPLLRHRRVRREDLAGPGQPRRSVG